MTFTFCWIKSNPEMNGEETYCVGVVFPEEIYNKGIIVSWAKSEVGEFAGFI